MAKQNESKLWAFLAYLLSIIGFVLVFVLKKSDKFAMYHAKQSLVLFIAWVVLFVVGMVPIIGWLVAFLGNLLLFVLWIIGIINALTGQMKPLWLIGKYADKINF